MKSTLTLLLLASSSFALAATNQNAKPKPAAMKLDPRLDGLLAAAYDMVDIEGECARQACITLNPDSECPNELVDTYRPQCAEILVKAGMKKKGETKVLDEGVREKLEEALGMARGVVERARAREGMSNKEGKDEGKDEI